MVDFNKPTVNILNNNNKIIGLSYDDYRHIRFNDKISIKNISSFKNDKFVKTILPIDNSNIFQKILKILVDNSIFISRYYEKIKIFNIGENEDEISQYKNYKLGNRSILNLFFSLNLLKFILNINKKNIKIIEIGCGYADICIFIKMLASQYNINIDYTIVDLKEWNNKVKEYLKLIKIDISNITFINYEDLCMRKINIGKYDLFFSKSAYSEFNENIRSFYLKNIISKCDYIFIIWNYLWKEAKDYGIDEYFKDKCKIETVLFFNKLDIVKSII